MILSQRGHTAVAAPAEGMPGQPERAVAADIARLRATVIDGGYCIGCGACASVPGSPIRMAMDGSGRLQATVSEDAAGAATRMVTPVCPFSETAADEDRIAAELFAGPG